jgi:4-methyl-5(b-hydroxyethyl)-thiazole monophosphate biosynthesis
MPHAITILADGFEEIEAVTVIDLLRRAGVEVTVLGLETLEVRGAHDLWIRVDMEFCDFRGDFDAVVLPGGMPGTTHLAASGELLDLIKTAHASGKLCAAICAAPTVLAKAGILGGKKATCYPGCEDRMADAKIVKKDVVVVDGNIITGRAAGTAVPFALELIKALAGEDTAKKTGAAIFY